MDYAKIGKRLAGQGLMPGYGQIFVKQSDPSHVWYVGGDGDEDGFGNRVISTLKKHGASRVTYEAEGFPPRDEWIQVYPVKTSTVSNVFCSTGSGGGVDPSCSPKGGSSSTGKNRGHVQMAVSTFTKVSKPSGKSSVTSDAVRTITYKGKEAGSIIERSLAVKGSGTEKVFILKLPNGTTSTHTSLSNAKDQFIFLKVEKIMSKPPKDTVSNSNCKLGTKSTALNKEQDQMKCPLKPHTKQLEVNAGCGAGTKGGGGFAPGNTCAVGKASAKASKSGGVGKSDTAAEVKRIAMTKFGSNPKNRADKVGPKLDAAAKVVKTLGEAKKIRLSSQKVVDEADRAYAKSPVVSKNGGKTTAEQKLRWMKKNRPEYIEARNTVELMYRVEGKIKQDRVNKKREKSGIDKEGYVEIGGQRVKPGSPAEKMMRAQVAESKAAKASWAKDRKERTEREKNYMPNTMKGMQGIKVTGGKSTKFQNPETGELSEGVKFSYTSSQGRGARMQNSVTLYKTKKGEWGFMDGDNLFADEGYTNRDEAMKAMRDQISSYYGPKKQSKKS